jgi:hypothetical protein
VSLISVTGFAVATDASLAGSATMDLTILSATGTRGATAALFTLILFTVLSFIGAQGESFS